MVLRRIVFCLPLLLVPAFAFAEYSDTFDLGEIVVSSYEEPSVKVPSTEEVTSAGIEERSAQSIDESLDFVPGVRLTIGQKREPYVTMRGFNQDKILILLDGIPIASPYFGYVDLDQIPAENVSRIKAVKNAASSLYGANTMGGVINIVTKKPAEKPLLEASSSLGPRGTLYNTISWAVKSKGIGLMFSGSRRESDGYDLSEKYETRPNQGSGLRDNSFFEKNAASIKLSAEHDDIAETTAFFNFIDNKKGIPPHGSTRGPRYWRFTQWRRWMAALASKLEIITGKVSAKGRVFFDKYDNTLESYDNPSYTVQDTNASWISVYDEYAFGASAYLFFRANDAHYFKGAFNFKNDVHKEQDDELEPWELYEIRTYSFGLEDEIQLVDKLTLSAGASYDILNKVKAYGIERGSDIGSFNPFILVNLSLTPDALIYSSVSKRTRFPTMNQLYSETSGNPGLKEQENINYEIGMKHGFWDLADVKVCYFYNNVKNLIDRSSRDAQYLNTSRAVFQGVEAAASAKLCKYLSGKAGYTLVDARDKNPGIYGRSDEEIQYVARHKADFELECITDIGFSCSAFGSYSGRRSYYDRNNNQNAMGGYFVCNAKASQKLFEHCEGSISVENIFDRDYQEEEGYPQAGRTYLFTLKATF
ncbi:TonB-dependent receptor plug domain-containing protein [Candidatus Omnitrophota bacterium]